MAAPIHAEPMRICGPGPGALTRVAIMSIGAVAQKIEGVFF